jgi:hypothetical protein
MKFEILLLNEQGTYTEHELTLPVNSDIHWDDFVNLRAVKDLLLAHPYSSIIDITPEDIYEDITTDADLSYDVDIDGLLHNG